MRRSLWLCLFVSSLAYSADFDLLIRHARIIDGSGNPWYRGDVGIKKGEIKAIGDLSKRSATRTIDAAERVVTPGFIDVHTHIEGSVDKIPRGDNYLMDGVTTVITGNCGSSKVDLHAWFQQLDRAPLGLNVGSLIGHNAVRSEVMGTANRAATSDELARMSALIDRAMKDGAVGFSTGLIYIPGTYANTAEVVALAKAVTPYHAVYASHMRDEGAHVREAIQEAVTVGEQAQLRVELSHFKIDNKRLWGSSDQSLALVEDYRRKGVDVVIDQYPYDHSSTNLGITMPSWALADGHDAIVARFQDAAMRAKIKAEMLDKLHDLGFEDYAYATIAAFAPDPSYEGKTISEVNRLKGRAATAEQEAETILDLYAQGFVQMIYHEMGEVDITRIMQSPNTAIASDGGIREFGKGVPHPRSYGTNARVLGEYVNRRRALTLEDAIRRMTTLPARTFQVRNRGLLAPHMAADIVIFDPAKVTDRATYQKPHQYSQGFDYVIVNGTLMVDEGKLTNAHGGQVIRANKIK